MDITNLQLIAWIGFFCIGVASGIAAGVLVEKFRNKLPYVAAVVVVFFIAGVVLVASSYPTIVLVEIPDLTGLSKDQAELRLQEKGLIFTSTEQYHDTEEIRRVISQDLSPRLLVRKGTEVHFIVSKGPKPHCIIDTMDSTSGWITYKDGEGSSINRKSIPGRTDNGIEITYDLKEWGWVTLNKWIDPSVLSEIEGIRFFYKGTGKPNTIEFKLMYSDGDEYNGIDTTFGFLINAATVTDDWRPVEVPYDMFECWWSDKSCDDNPGLDLNKVRKIEFAISNKPEDGDASGSGKVIIDDVQGITSSIPASTPTPTPTPHIEITAPTNGEDVSREYLAKGTHSGLIENPNLNLYVLLLPHSTEKWWVQNLPSIYSDGSWETTIYFGTETLGIGGDFTVSAIITTKDLEVAETLLSLPSYVAEYHVTVTRPI
jgi:hypothetical protein